MTPKQVEQFNRMHDALTTIAKKYQTPNQMRRKPEFGLSFDEMLEGAYENIQATAAAAVRRTPRITSNARADLAGGIVTAWNTRTVDGRLARAMELLSEVSSAWDRAGVDEYDASMYAVMEQVDALLKEDA